MSCQSLRDVIVEVGRGRDTGAGTTAAIDSHVGHCPSCAALLARERQLTEGLRTLAAAASADGPSEAMHGRLLRAFAEQHTAVLSGARRRRMWLQVAAAAVLAAGAFVWWRSPGERQTGGPAGADATISKRQTPLAPGVRAKADDTANVARPAARRRPGSASSRSTSSGVVRAEGFVILPAALGLPDFESGEIVRMELPVTSLPAYGIDIEPDAKTTPVEADVLVGQDGQARAIRLVTAGSSR